MKIAVVGSGIAGHVAAYQLSKEHQVDLYEAEDRFGGHANTAWVGAKKSTPVDTGFIVYNELTYPGLTALLAELEVETTATDMGFGAHDEETGLLYSTHTLNSLFAQRRQLISPRFLVMWRDFFKFRDYSYRFMKERWDDITTTLGQALREAGVGHAFRDHFLYAMTGAIWSTAPQEMEHHPAQTFFRFMHNHHMLDATGQPVWRTVKGGSRAYVEAIAKRGNFRRWSGCPVKKILRNASGEVTVLSDQGLIPYDEVVVATHAPDALQLLDQPTQQEREVLGNIRYQPNTAVLHQDTSMMPPLKRAWASWNVFLPKEKAQRIEVTYDMNRLQHVEGEPWLVTLNPLREIDPAKTDRVVQYEHPFFDMGALKAQRRWSEISGTRGIHFCGAYWRWGFHEDGLWSAMRVVDAIQERKLAETPA